MTERTPRGDPERSRAVLFASWNAPPRRGGIEELVARLHEHLRARGVAVTLLTGWSGGAPEATAGVVRAALPGIAGYLAWLVWRMARVLFASRPPILLSSGALVGSLVELAARLRGLPHAVLVYGTDVTYPARWYQWWLRRTLRSVPRFLAISAAVERELTARGLASAERIRRLPPGVDPALVDAPFDPAVEAPGRPVLLFVGRVIERKGLEPFLRDCLPRILARRDVEVWIVGGEPVASLAHDTGLLGRLRRELEAGELGPHLRFLGAVSDATLRAAYRRASLLVLPAVPVTGDLEGFGIVFLEAALFGVPAVSTRLGGIPDAVADGETGVLVEPRDWQAFADAVVDLLADEVRLREFGRRARERALRHYDWRSIAEQCHDLLLTASRRD